MSLCVCGHVENTHAHPGALGTPCAAKNCGCKKFSQMVRTTNADSAEILSSERSTSSGLRDETSSEVSSLHAEIETWKAVCEHLKADLDASRASGETLQQEIDALKAEHAKEIEDLQPGRWRTFRNSCPRTFPNVPMIAENCSCVDCVELRNARDVEAARDVLKRDADFQWAGHDRADAIRAELLERDTTVETLQQEVEKQCPTITRKLSVEVTEACACSIQTRHEWFTAFTDERNKYQALRTEHAALKVTASEQCARAERAIDVWEKTEAEVGRLTAALQQETRIVDGVWGALGISTYEQARGKHIAELVSELRAALQKAQQWVSVVVKSFSDSEKAGYRSRDRQYALEILGQIPLPSPSSSVSEAGPPTPLAKIYKLVNQVFDKSVRLHPDEFVNAVLEIQEICRLAELSSDAGLSTAEIAFDSVQNELRGLRSALQTLQRFDPYLVNDIGEDYPMRCWTEMRHGALSVPAREDKWIRASQLDALLKGSAT